MKYLFGQILAVFNAYCYIAHYLNYGFCRETVNDYSRYVDEVQKSKINIYLLFVCCLF